MPQTEEDPKHASSAEWTTDSSGSDIGYQSRSLTPMAPSSPSRASPSEEPSKHYRQESLAKSSGNSDSSESDIPTLTAPSPASHISPSEETPKHCCQESLVKSSDSSESDIPTLTAPSPTSRISPSEEIPKHCRQESLVKSSGVPESGIPTPSAPSPPSRISRSEGPPKYYRQKRPGVQLEKISDSSGPDILTLVAPPPPVRVSPSGKPSKPRRQKPQAVKPAKSQRGARASTAVRIRAGPQTRDAEGLQQPHWAMHVLQEATVEITPFALSLLQSFLLLLKFSMLLLKWPFTIFLTLYIVLWVIASGADKLTVSSANMLAELKRAICDIPLVPHLSSQCAPPVTRDLVQFINPGKASEMQEELAEIMVLNKRTRGSALGMKSSAYAVRVLMAKVNATQLSCKDDMMEELEDFRISAEEAVGELSRFSAGMYSMIDRVAVMDKKALKTLQSVRERRKLHKIALSNPLHTLNFLSALYSLATGADGEVALREDFATLIKLMVETIPPLTRHAEALVRTLERSERALFRVTDLAEMEKVVVNDQSSKAQRRGLLAVLWMKLTSKGERDLLRTQGEMLDEVVNCQQDALEIAKEMLMALRSMQGEMGQLYALTSSSTLADYPLDVHMEGIRRAMVRLDAVRKVVGLEY
ncbi:MAG: hypothetical protein M1839_006488 [Geoglossum umbratile]|nr:MAG: hypothetical protein M1839_006488 [Geoglossum umbratile]